MHRFLVVALVLAATVAASAQTNEAFLNRIVSARFVCVTSVTGDQFSLSTDPEDRRLAARVESQLISWKRFTVIHDPSQADLIVQVRAAGTVRPRVGIQAGSRPGPNGTNVPYHGTILAADAGPKNDLLSVFDASRYPDSVVL